MEQYEDLLDSVNQLAIKLNTLKGAAALSKLTPLKSFERNATRWSGTYDMLKREDDIENFIVQINDQEVGELLSNVREQEQTLGITVKELLVLYIMSLMCIVLYI